MPNDEELLAILEKLRDVLAEEREGRIRDDDIGLPEQLNTLGTAEVDIALQGVDANLLWVGHVVAVAITVVDEVDRPLAGILAEEVRCLALVAGGDEAAQPQLLEVVGEVGEKVAHPRIIAVAQHCFPLEVVGIMP